jgi:pilus assembly protein Flp/PilA
MTSLLTKLWAEESGQGMAEYGLILALVAVIAMGAFAALGNGVLAKVNAVATEIAK